MNEVLDFLTTNSTFYLATVEGDQPRVRPFGFVMPWEGKLCFCTNNQKPVFKQMAANPKLELCAASPEGQWLRVSGKAVVVTSPEVKRRAFEVMPHLKQMYGENDGLFELFCLEDAVATFAGFGTEPRVVQI